MSTHTRESSWGSHFPGTPWWREPGDERTIAELIRRSPVVVNARAKVHNVELLAVDMGFHHLAVVDETGAPVGIVCTCDLRRVGPEAEVLECMSTPPVTIEESAFAAEAAELMRDRQVGALLVLENDRLVGLLTRGDLRRAGVLSSDECPRCVACHTHHHVRTDPRTNSSLCLDCQEQARRWRFDDFGDGLGEE